MSDEEYGTIRKGLGLMLGLFQEARAEPENPKQDEVMSSAGVSPFPEETAVLFAPSRRASCGRNDGSLVG